MQPKYLLFALLALSSAPLGSPRNKSAYPDQDLARFVVDKLDSTSLPSPFQPKKEKGKKTFADYGFQPQDVGENEAVIAGRNGAKSLSIKILDRTSTGIFVCMAQPAAKGETPVSESVVLLKWNEREGSLKGHATFREFTECPAVGGADTSESSY